MDFDLGIVGTARLDMSNCAVRILLMIENLNLHAIEGVQDDRVCIGDTFVDNIFESPF